MGKTHNTGGIKHPAGLRIDMGVMAAWEIYHMTATNTVTEGQAEENTHFLPEWPF